MSIVQKRVNRIH